SSPRKACTAVRGNVPFARERLTSAHKALSREICPPRPTLPIIDSSYVDGPCLASGACIASNALICAVSAGIAHSPDGKRNLSSKHGRGFECRDEQRNVPGL